MNELFDTKSIEIRAMNDNDIPAICTADNDNSEDNVSYLKRHLECQRRQECSALIATYQGKPAGFVFLYYKCKWGGLANCNIPGIVDLKVFEEFRQKKIATALMDKVEEIAVKHSNKVYLDVCMNSEYGPAQRLYVKRGYVPDGKGVYYEEKV